MSTTRFDLLVVLISALAFATLPAVASPYWLHIAVMALLFAYLGTAWNLVGGYTGALAFTHPIYFAIGGYCAAYLATHNQLSPWLSLAPALVLSAVTCVLIELVVMRFKLPVLSYALATMAFSHIVLFIVRSTPALGGVSGLAVPIAEPGLWTFQPSSKTGYFYIILVAMIFAALLVIWFKNSRLGLEARGVRDNQRAAEAVGVQPVLVRIRVGILSAALTTFGGVFYGQFAFFVDPITFLSPLLFIEVILFTAVGGMGTLWGPVLGAMLLAPIGEGLRGTVGTDYPGIDRLVFGIIFIVIIMLMPHGIISRHRYRRRAGPKLRDSLRSLLLRRT